MKNIVAVDYINIKDSGIEYSKPRLWYEGGDSIIIHDFFPYCYIKIDENYGDDDVEKLERLLRSVSKKQKINIVKIERVKKSDAGVGAADFLKIFFSNTMNVPRMRDMCERLGIESRETDMPYHFRYLLDSQIEIVNQKTFNPLILSLDIEAYNKERFPSARNGDRIFIISLADSNGNSWVFDEHKLGGESNVIIETIKIINKINPDIIVTYNGESFDFPYILERARNLNIEFNIGRDGSNLYIDRGGRVKCVGRSMVDLLIIAQRDLKEFKNQQLKFICQELGIVNKDDREIIEGREIAYVWDTDPERVLKYAADDAKATLKLGFKLLKTQYAYCDKETAQIPLEDVCSASRSRIAEMSLLNLANKENIVYPNKRPIEIHEDDDGEELFEGAVVFDPPSGIVNDVRVIDVGSMYPSIVLMHNLSPETLCKYTNCKEEHYLIPDVGHKFHKKPEGFIKRSVQHFVNLRKQLKNEMEKLNKSSPEYSSMYNQQFAMKEITNTLAYGLMAWVLFRWFNKEYAESITALGRYYNLEIKRTAEEEFGLNVIYGDTDSLFLIDSPKILDLINIINKRLPVNLGDEGIWHTAFFYGKKKRYILYNKETKRYKVRGLETRRGDWSAIAKNVQENVTKFVIESDNVEDGVKRAVKYTADIVSKIKEGKIDKRDLVIRKKLTRHPNEYKSIQAHVEAIRKEIKDDELIRSLIESKIDYVIMCEPKDEIQSRRARLAQYLKDDDWENIDKDYYIEKQVIIAAGRILNVFGVSEDEMKGRPHQVNLSRWF